MSGTHPTPATFLNDVIRPAQQAIGTASRSPGCLPPSPEVGHGGAARGDSFRERVADVDVAAYLAANCVLPNITSRSASVIWPLRCFSASTATPRCTAGRAAIASCHRFTFG